MIIAYEVMIIALLILIFFIVLVYVLSKSSSIEDNRCERMARYWDYDSEDFFITEKPDFLEKETDHDEGRIIENSKTDSV